MPLSLRTFLLLAVVLAAFGCEDDKPAATAQTTDAGLDDDASAPDVDEARPDASDLDGEQTCVLQVLSDRAPWTCAVAVSDNAGCDALGLCLCEHHRDVHVEDKTIDPAECLVGLTIPRGMITLADVCPRAGDPGTTTLDDVVGRVGLEGIVADVVWDGEQVTASPACGEVGAFSLQGEGSSIFVTLGQAGQPLPPVGSDHWYVSDYDLTSTPFLTLDDVARFHSGTMELALNDAGKVRVEAALGGDGADLVGRTFLVHSDVRALFVGTIVTLAMSSTREGPVVVLEEVAEAGFGTVSLRDGYPSDAPASLDSMALAGLRARFAAAGKLVDNTCVSSCGCGEGQACRAGSCSFVASCESDADCCLQACVDGECVAR